MPIDQITIADKLQDLGYVTGLVGKWHLGTRDEYHPLNRGFDYFYGLLTEGSDYLDPTNPDARIIYRNGEENIRLALIRVVSCGQVAIVTLFLKIRKNLWRSDT